MRPGFNSKLVRLEVDLSVEYETSDKIGFNSKLVRLEGLKALLYIHEWVCFNSKLVRLEGEINGGIHPIQNIGFNSKLVRLEDEWVLTVYKHS